MHRHTDPDHIHSNWKDKLEKALQNTARTENRRVIMRQDGDSLIPIGVSSSHTGDALASFVEQNSHLGHNGPGGSIVLHGYVFEQELQRHIQQQMSPLQRTRRSMDRTRALHLAPEELDEILLRETLRRSRMEHQEEQRRHSMNEARPESRTGQPRRLSLLPRRLANGAAMKLKGSRSEADDGPKTSAPGSHAETHTPAASSARTSVSGGRSTPTATTDRATPAPDSSAVPAVAAPAAAPQTPPQLLTNATPHRSSVNTPRDPSLAEHLPAASQASEASIPPRGLTRSESIAGGQGASGLTEPTQSSAALGMKAWGHMDRSPGEIPVTPRSRMSTPVLNWVPPDGSRSSMSYSHPSTPVVPSPRVRYALARDAASNSPAGTTTNPFRARAAYVETQGL